MLHCATRLVSVSFSSDLANLDVVNGVIRRMAWVNEALSNTLDGLHVLGSLFWSCLLISSSSSKDDDDDRNMCLEVPAPAAGLLGLR